VKHPQKEINIPHISSLKSMQFLLLLLTVSVYGAPVDINDPLSDEQLQELACTPQTGNCPAFNEAENLHEHTVDPWSLIVGDDGLGPERGSFTRNEMIDYSGTPSSLPDNRKSSSSNRASKRKVALTLSTSGQLNSGSDVGVKRAKVEQGQTEQHKLTKTDEFDYFEALDFLDAFKSDSD
jgi:hypothetical protein